MFEKVVDEWGDVTYNLTGLGYAALVVLVLAVIVAAGVLAARKKEEHVFSAKKIAVVALCVALSFVTSNIKIISMPMGGAVTLLSMFFIVLIAYWFGLKTGIAAGIALGLINLIADPYIMTIPQVLCDYPLAFGALGLAGLGRKIPTLVEKKLGKFNFKIGGLQIGYLIGVLGRYFFAFISGWVFFGMYAPEGWNAVAYSLAYNGAYLGLEALITLIILMIPGVNNAVEKMSKEVENS